MLLCGVLPKTTRQREPRPILAKQCCRTRCGMTFVTNDSRRMYCSNKCKNGQRADLAYKARHDALGRVWCKGRGCEKRFKPRNRVQVYCCHQCWKRTMMPYERKHDVVGTMRKCRGCETEFLIEDARHALRVWCHYNCKSRCNQKKARDREAAKRLAKKTSMQMGEAAE